MSYFVKNPSELEIFKQYSLTQGRLYCHIKKREQPSEIWTIRFSRRGGRYEISRRFYSEEEANDFIQGIKSFIPSLEIRDARKKSLD